MTSVNSIVAYSPAEREKKYETTRRGVQPGRFHADARSVPRLAVSRTRLLGLRAHVPSLTVAGFLSRPRASDQRPVTGEILGHGVAPGLIQNSLSQDLGDTLTSLLGVPADPQHLH